jgi:hypothetical protein
MTVDGPRKHWFVDYVDDDGIKRQKFFDSKEEAEAADQDKSLLVDNINLNKIFRGDWAFHIACAWLLSKGYYVFRNISHFGPVDVIGLKDGALGLFDVKLVNGKVKNAGKINREARTMGVKRLCVYKTGECFIEGTDNVLN